MKKPIYEPHPHAHKLLHTQIHTHPHSHADTHIKHTNTHTHTVSGLELARALTLKAVRLDASHAWVQKNAHKILMHNNTKNRLRPSDFKRIQGVGVVRKHPVTEELTLVGEGVESEPITDEWSDDVQGLTT